MDAKGIWNTANSRIINSSTHKVMEKPKLSDFKGANRKIRTKKYQDALRKYRDFLAKEKKQKLLNTTKETRRGRRPLNSSELKKKNAEKKPKGPFAADRVGKVNLESKAYKEAKRINESIPINSSKKKEEKKSDSNIGPVKDGKKYADSLGNKKQYKQVTQEELDKKLAESKENKKEAPKKKTTREKFNEKFIKTKGGRLAKRGTVAARRAENREAARKRAQAAARLRIKKKKEKKS